MFFEGLLTLDGGEGGGVDGGGDVFVGHGGGLVWRSGLGVWCWKEGRGGQVCVGSVGAVCYLIGEDGGVTTRSPELVLRK